MSTKTSLSGQNRDRRRWLLILCLPLAACATQTSTTASNASPTRQAFIRQADQICQTARPQVRAIQAELRAAGPHIALTPADRQHGASLLRQAASIGDQENRQIAALAPPPADRATVSAYLAKATEFDDVARQAAVALLNVNVPELQALTVQLRAAGGSARQIAHRYGFRVCGSA